MSDNEFKINHLIPVSVLAKKGLTTGARILIELLEQFEDYNYLYFHRVGIGRSVRAARYAHDAYRDGAAERRRKQTFNRLREAKYIKLRKRGEQIVAELTKNGRIKALQAIIRAWPENYSDENICLVSFDFPEATRTARNNFRWFLKGAGFKYLQGSVWSIKKDIIGPMKELVKLLKIDRWVEIFMVMK